MLAGDEVELADEAVVAVHGDHPVLRAVTLHDRHGALLHDEEVVALVALPEEDFAGLHPAHPAECPEGAALRLVEPREGAAAVGDLLDARAERLAHPVSDIT